MKANWKIALMCLAAIAMVACKDKNPAEGGGDQGGDQGGGGQSGYVAKISVKDKSVADWDALDQAKVAKFDAPEKPVWDGVHMIKVYADEVYINWILVFDPVKYAKHRDVDVMHIFLNIDNNEATGGYYDLFEDACADLMFEGSLFGEPNVAINYSPSVSEWIGDPNGEGWDNWSQVAASIKGESQFVNDSTIEARIMIENIPGKNKFAKDGFGFGATLTQNFEPAAVGFLPQGNTPDGDLIGRANMLFVPFDK